MDYSHYCPQCNLLISTFNPYAARKKEETERKKNRSDGVGGPLSPQQAPYSPLVSVSVTRTVSRTGSSFDNRF